MFRVSSAYLPEDTTVYMQHMVLSLSTRVRGGLSVHSLSENWPWGEVVGGCLKTPTNNLSPTVSSHSSCVPTSPLTPGKEPRYILYKRLIRPQGRTGRVSTRRKSLVSTGVRTPDHPACSESLYRQHYPGSLQNYKVIIFNIFMLLHLFLLGLIWLIPFNVSKQWIAFIRLVEPLRQRIDLKTQNRKEERNSQELREFPEFEKLKVVYVSAGQSFAAQRSPGIRQPIHGQKTNF